MNEVAHLRAVIEERIEILEGVKQIATDKHKQHYDLSVETLRWVLTQMPAPRGNKTGGLEDGPQVLCHK